MDSQITDRLKNLESKLKTEHKTYSEVQSEFEEVGGWNKYIKPEMEKLLAYYQDLLVEASLSSGPIEVRDPVTGAEGAVSPPEVAARISGLKFAIGTVERILKKGREKYKPEVL